MISIRAARACDTGFRPEGVRVLQVYVQGEFRVWAGMRAGPVQRAGYIPVRLSDS